MSAELYRLTDGGSGMKSGLHTSITRTIHPVAAKFAEPLQLKLRLRLKAEEPATGFVDGAWWPRSRDLPDELPALLAVLDARLERVERVTYNLTAWSKAPRLLLVSKQVIRVEGFRSQHADTVTLIGDGGKVRLTLLVVPPETTRDAAHRILMAASQRGGADEIGELLTRGGRTALAGNPALALAAVSQVEDTQRWDDEGGRAFG